MNNSSPIELQQESCVKSRLGYGVPITGLFHLQMAVLNLLFRSHKWNDDEPHSLRHWMTLIWRSDNMWNFQSRTIKDFHTCHAFFNHIVDAHVVAALGAQLGAESWDELCNKLKTFN